MLTRAIFAALLWPLAALIGAVMAVAFAFYLLTIQPLLVLALVGAVVVAVIALGLWERHRFRPPPR